MGGFRGAAPPHLIIDFLERKKIIESIEKKET